MMLFLTINYDNKFENHIRNLIRKSPETKVVLKTLRYTNADLKISLYVRAHIKTIPWKFCIVNPRNSGVIFTWNLYFSKKVD